MQMHCRFLSKSFRLPDMSAVHLHYSKGPTLLTMMAQEGS
jgi:hypothetical protein